MDDALTSGTGPLWAGAMRRPLQQKCTVEDVSNTARHNQFMAGVMATLALTVSATVVRHARVELVLAVPLH